MKRIVNEQMVRLIVFIVILAVLGMGVAWGQEEQNPPAEVAKQKSGKTAFYISLAGTAVPSLIGWLGRAPGTAFWGVYLGPSLGYFYGGISGKGWNGIFLRTGLLALAVVGVSIAWSSENEAMGVVLGVAGGLGFYISAIYDIVTVWSRVEKHNTTPRKQTFFISPYIAPQKKVFGISASFQF